MKHLLILILALLLLGYYNSAGQTISVTGSPIFSSSDLNVSEAGNNFTSTITSSSNSNININNAVGSWLFWTWNIDWSISVYRVDNWNSSLKVYVKRTGSGTGSSSSSITGGNSNYQEVKSTQTSFFSGSGNRSSVPVSYQISGISMTLPADIYTTTIYYTISSN